MNPEISITHMQYQGLVITKPVPVIRKPRITGGLPRSTGARNENTFPFQGRQGGMHGGAAEPKGMPMQFTEHRPHVDIADFLVIQKGLMKFHMDFRNLVMSPHPVNGPVFERFPSVFRDPIPKMRLCVKRGIKKVFYPVKIDRVGGLF